MSPCLSLSPEAGAVDQLNYFNNLKLNFKMLTWLRPKKEKEYDTHECLAKNNAWLKSEIIEKRKQTLLPFLCAQNVISSNTVNNSLASGHIAEKFQYFDILFNFS